MVPLYVQTLLLLGAAYFIGAALACIIRRSLFAVRPAPTAERRVDPLPEAVQPSTGPSRFGSAPARQELAGVSLAPARKPEPAPAQDLKRIRLIDAELEAGLNRLGVRRYDEIAAWMQPDVRRIGDALGLGGRINQENWIEQAQVLAKGGETYYATRRARGEAANAAPTPDEGERRSTSIARTVPAGGAPFDSPPDVSERAAFADRQASAATPTSATAPTAPGTLPPTVPAVAVPIRPATPATHDNL